MKKNVGLFDKWIRVGVAMVLILFAIFANIWALYIVAAVLIATALVGKCGLYALFGITTCKMKD